MSYDEALAAALAALKQTEELAPGHIIHPIDALTNAGFRVEHGTHTWTPEEKQVWEHPEATKRNQKLRRGTPDVMQAVFCTLYGFPEYPALAPLHLIVGSCGNTRSYDIWPPS